MTANTNPGRSPEAARRSTLNGLAWKAVSPVSASPSEWWPSLHRRRPSHTRHFCLSPGGIMRIFDGFFSFMRELWALVKYAPWLPFAAIAGEAVQHAVEISFGMYVRGDGISPGYATNMRMLAAAIKVIGFIVTIALTMRCTRTEAIVFDQRAMTLDRSVVLAVIIVPVAIHYALNFLLF